MGDLNDSPNNKRSCDICGNELKDNEETYCHGCIVSTDNLIPDEEEAEEEANDE